MNEKMRNQIAEMKEQTIGVEVEMNSITRRSAAKAAAEFFGTGQYDYTDYRNGYRTWSAWDAHEKIDAIMAEKHGLSLYSIYR